MNEQTTQFDYAQVERDMNEQTPEPEQDPNVIYAGLQVARILDWIDRGRGALAKSIRLKAALFFFGEFSAGGVRTQRELARTVGAGMTKAAISRACNQFRREFRLDDALDKIRGMRSAAAVEKFRDLVSARHADRLEML